MIEEKDMDKLLSRIYTRFIAELHKSDNKNTKDILYDNSRGENDT